MSVAVFTVGLCDSVSWCPTRAREFTELAAAGERCGWDAVFTWEAVWGEHARVVLGAAAMVTERIRLGTLLTPASRWRPWDLASVVGTVDRSAAAGR